MAKLLNIKTNLSEHLAPQYGYDRRGAGPRKTNASGQPYEIQEIPKRSFNESDYDNGTGPKVAADFLLRGGQLLPEITARDVSRLTKMFTDLKSPKGLLFTAKQEVLSRTGVNVLAVSNSEDNPKNRRAFNNGIYLPTSTIAQAAVNAIGGHLLKQGIDPTASTGPGGGILGGLLDGIPGLNPLDPLGNPTYFSTVAYSERRGTDTTTSRLVGFTKFNVNANTNGENELYNYSGGPGSVLGVGRTSVKMLNDQRTGLNNPNLAGSAAQTATFFLTSNASLSPPNLPTVNFGSNDYSVFKRKSVSYQSAKIFSKSVSRMYESMGGVDLIQAQYTTFNNESILQKFSTSVFQRDKSTNELTFNPQAPEVVSGLGSSLDYNQLMDSKPVAQAGSPNNDYLPTEILQDFREKTKSNSVESPDYSIPTNRYEQRVKLGDAGAKLPPNTSYVAGIDYGTHKDGSKKGLDAITSLPLYKALAVAPENNPGSDLCNFRIGVIDNDTPSLKTYIHFRAFLDTMDDNYTAGWSKQKFAGRAENLYNYEGFDRSVNISWTVAAQSKQELIPMYQKLNYLASVCAPDYSSNGYMRGNLITLTVGGYLYEQVGIMQGINYGVPMESPWEIGIKDIDVDGDPTVKQLPFMIKVSGFSFIPIHDFTPSIQKNTFEDTNGEGPGTPGNLETFGEQRYIALENGFNTNYAARSSNSSAMGGIVIDG